MAHSCPECGEACYCGGEVDDILIEDPEQEDACTHCSEAGFDDEDEDDWYDDDDEEEWL